MLPEEATNSDNVKNRSRSPFLADNVVETCNKMYEDTPSKHHPTLSMEGVGGRCNRSNSEIDTDCRFTTNGDILKNFNKHSPGAALSVITIDARNKSKLFSYSALKHLSPTKATILAHCDAKKCHGQPIKL